MSSLQQSPRLRLSVASAAEARDRLQVRPAGFNAAPGALSPAKEVGDVVLADRTLWVSLGKAEGLNPAVIRKAGARVAGWLLARTVEAVALPEADFAALGVENALEAFCEGLLLGAFRFERHKKPEGAAPLEVQVLPQGERAPLERMIAAVTARGQAVNLTREWSHEPPNVINPLTLSERAQALAEAYGLKCTMLDERALQEMGAGAILSVGQGSATPSRLIVLEYPGRGEGRGRPPVAVVGKAITFDTGGYSLKNTRGIVGMKFDKCGGMAVLGILQGAAALKLSVPVVGVVAAAENMISERAYRPNDIITSLSGKTIEIISTDAEGRMVLADALTYTARRYKPRAMVDLATLTGGVRVALGTVRAGLLSNNDALADALLDAGERTGERLWRLPLDDEYFDLIRGADSDLKNSAGAPIASTIVGGMFLKQFVPEGTPWAHIDIAGTATVEKGAGGGREATGFGVRLLLDYLASLA